MGAGWRVTHQRQQEELTSGGQFRTVVIVSFELIPSGTAGSVSVPLSQYEPSFVESAISEYADKMAAVENL